MAKSERREARGGRQEAIDRRKVICERRETGAGCKKKKVTDESSIEKREARGKMRKASKRRNAKGKRRKASERREARGERRAARGESQEGSKRREARGKK